PGDRARDRGAGPRPARGGRPGGRRGRAPAARGARIRGAPDGARDLARRHARPARGLTADRSPVDERRDRPRAAGGAGIRRRDDTRTRGGALVPGGLRAGQGLADIGRMEEQTEIGSGSIRSLFARRPDPYAGADLASARRMTGLIWVLGTIVGIALLPLSPVVGSIGALGWAAIGVMTLCALAACRWLTDPRRQVSFDLLLGLSYVSMAFLVLAQWLTGGADSPLRELYLLSLLGGVCVHSPRRSGLFLIVSAAAMCSPLAYDGWSRATAVDLAARGAL